MGFGSSRLTCTHFLEAKKLAFAKTARSFYADPAFNDIPVAALDLQAIRQPKRRATDRCARKEEPPTATPLATPRWKQGDTIYL